MTTNQTIRNRRFSATASSIALLLLVAPACGGEEDPGDQPGSFEVRETQQSSCKTKRGATSNFSRSASNASGSASAGTLKVEQTGGVLRIEHRDANYNCASKVEMAVARDGDVLRVSERIKNPEQKAMCTCDFDISVEVTGLAQGAYRLRLADADGRSVGEVGITIGDSGSDGGLPPCTRCGPGGPEGTRCGAQQDADGKPLCAPLGE